MQSRRPLALAGAVVAATAALLLWNATQYPWQRSYDAGHSARYAHVLVDEHRLPGKSDTDVWHNPPLFYAVAGVLDRAAGHAGLRTPQRVVQMLSASCVLGIVVLSGLLARELFPDRPWLWLAALVVAALTPVLVRAGSLYHPEPLATFLTTAGLFVVVRGLARGGLGWRGAAAAGVLFALANLTRTWALAVLAAALVGLCLRAIARRDRSAVVAVSLVLGLAVLLDGPWLVYKAVRFGNPLAYSQPNPEQWRGHGRPGAFWLDLSLPRLFERPYQPSFVNRLAPDVYADWWGDYWRVYRVPLRLTNRPAVLPAEYARPRRRQMVAGLWLTAATLAGAVALAIRASRRRDEALASVVLALVFVAAAFAAFLWRYPKLDGDNIKALYLLNAAPLAAVAAAYALASIAREHVVLRLGVVLVTAVVAISTLDFLILPRA